MIDIVQFNVDNNLLVYVFFFKKETHRHNVFGHKTLGVSVVWISLAQNKKHYKIKRKWKHEERGLSTSVVWCSDVVLMWLGKSFEAQTRRETHTCVYTVHKHIYRCKLSLDQTHNSLVLCQRCVGNRLSFYRVSNFIWKSRPFCDSVFSVGLRWRMGVCALLPS